MALNCRICGAELFDRNDHKCKPEVENRYNAAHTRANNAEFATQTPKHSELTRLNAGLAMMEAYGIDAD